MADTVKLPTFCRKCKKDFPTWQKLHIHKIQEMASHMTCWICESSYHSAEALKRHNDQTHPNEQELKCPSCNEVFARAGAMIAHLEQTVCYTGRDIYAANRAEMRKGEGVFEQIRQTGVDTLSATFASVSLNNKTVPTAKVEPLVNITNSLSGGGSSLVAPKFQLSTNNFPALTPMDKKDAWFGQGFLGSSVQEQVVTPSKKMPWLMDDNMLGGEFEDRTPQAKLNKTSIHAIQNSSPQAKQKAAPTYQSPAQAPAPKITPRPVAAVGRATVERVIANNHQQQAWIVPRTWVPDAPAPQAWPANIPATPVSAPPPAQAITVVTPTSEPLGAQFSKYDPKNPEFKAYKYFIEFTQKYKCPYSGCPKSFDTRAQFTRHLTSQAHYKDLQHGRCDLCLRYFDNATALVQHVESQGVRCQFRTAPTFDTYIDKITGKTIALDGLLPDDTNKYEVQAVGPETRHNVHKAMNEHKENVISSRLDRWTKDWDKNKDSIKW